MIHRAQSQSVEPLRAYLRLLAGESAAGGRLLEIRFALVAGGMGRLFASTRAITKTAALLISLAQRTDVYTGVVLRAQRAGGRTALGESHLVWVEIDSPDGLAQLAELDRPPTLTIASGTPGHVHAYWQLAHPVDIDELEQANRRLARHLGGDLACVDAARIFRPPGTRNYKHRPSRPVQLLQLHPARRYQLAELITGLPHLTPLPSPNREHKTRPQRRVDAQLRAIPACDYAQALTGRGAGRDGKIACPFHEDRTPSLQLYDDGTWYCYGCRRGGSIYDFAALLWGLDTKGEDFLTLRRRLLDQLAITSRREGNTR